MEDIASTEEPNLGNDNEFGVYEEVEQEEIQEFSNIFLDEEGAHDCVRDLVFSDESPFGDIPSNDNFSNDDEFVDNLGEDDVEDIGNDDNEDAHEVSNRAAWKLSGGCETYHVPSFNNVDEIIGIIGDPLFFSSEDYANDDDLGAGTLYRSKAHLKWVVHDHYIKNQRHL